MVRIASLTNALHPLILVLSNHQIVVTMATVSVRSDYLRACDG